MVSIVTLLSWVIGLGFYQGARGLYPPTDGNLYAPRQAHGMPDFVPIKRYEGNDTKNPLNPNGNALYQHPSIDDLLLRDSVKKREEDAMKPYLFMTDRPNYLH